MPFFGDYETVGDAIAQGSESGHITTVWKARRSGAREGEFHVVKVYAPHRKSSAGAAEDALDHDRGLEFLEGVKQLKKAQTEGARCLAPIHALGTSPDGAWFATDYFPRGSLGTLINRRGKVDSAALRQVLRCIVSACLDLQQLRGFSHGNLKTSNIFLTGKTRPLRNTPLVLADAFPAAPLKLASLGAEDRHTLGELLKQTMEAQDLRAIGELILQLVHGRLYSRSDEYQWPVKPSPAWDKLGKDGERWLELCNQLLDPQLSLEQINLQSLGKKFGGPALGAKVLPLAAAIVGACLIAGAVFGFTKWKSQKYQAALSAAQQAFEAAGRDNDPKTRVQDLAEAQRQIQMALKRNAAAGSAMDLQSKINDRISAEYNSMLKLATQKVAANAFSEATGMADLLLILKPGDSEAQRLRANIEQERTFQAALAAAQAAFDRGDYLETLKQAGAGLAIHSDSPALLKLKQNADTKILQTKADDLQQSMASGDQLLQGSDYAGAERQFAHALELARELKNSDKEAQAVSGQTCAANVLKANAARDAKSRDDEMNFLTAALAARKLPELQTRLDSLKKGIAQNEKREMLERALTKANDLLDKADYAGAEQSFGNAAELAAELSDKTASSQADDGRKCAGYLSKADTARKSGSTDEEIQWLKAALQLRKLSGAQARLDELQKNLNDRIAMSNALAEGKRLLKVAKDYAGAEKSFAQALKLASELKDEGTRAEADVEAQCAKALIKAESAATLDDQITALETAVRLDKDGPWAQELEKARTTRANQAAKAEQFKKLQELMRDANQSLTASDYSAARDAFKRAANLANTLGETKTATEADALKAVAENAIKAEDARKKRLLDEEIKFLEQAAKSKSLPAINDRLKDAMSQNTKFQNALGEAGKAFEKSDFEAAIKKAEEALAIKSTDPQAKTLKDNATDANQARSHFDKGEYQQATQICQKHRDVQYFKNLLQTNSLESGILEDAQAKFGRGDYSFVADLESQSYSAKQPFAQLLIRAKPESDLYSKLKELVADPKNWAQVKGLLNTPTNQSAVAKSTFAQFREWSQANDPVQKLDMLLKTFEVWFGIQRPNKDIVDPYSHKPAERITTDIPIDSYLDLLNKLKGEFNKAGELNSDRANRFDNITKHIYAQNR